MPVGLGAPDKLMPVAGIRLAATYAGIRKKSADDLLLIELAVNARVAAAFTRNQFCAAPVTIAKQHLQAAVPRYLLINAGNANAGTGEAGLANARKSCDLVASQTGVAANSVLPFSTGVIGQHLPVEKIQQALPQLFASLAEDAWMRSANAIMTTDTVPKAISRMLRVGDNVVTISGIAKGAGMICPNMATMLGFIATDAGIEQAALDALHRRLVEQTFNRITVDGDTSTNDACVLMATAAGIRLIEGGKEWAAFEQALLEVYRYLAQAIVRDGEGARKFVAVKVTGGKTSSDCDTIARAVAHSPLVKTALSASDANWGRILAAVGRAGVPLDIQRVNLAFNGVAVLQHGQPHPDYTEQAGSAAMAQADIEIVIDIGLGESEATIWTTDLSHDYVTINAEYRT